MMFINIYRRKAHSFGNRSDKTKLEVAYFEEKNATTFYDEKEAQL